MKTLTNNILLLCFGLFLSSQLCAQDIVQTYLTSNPIVAEKWNELKNKRNLTVPLADTLELDTLKGGILDDFSYPGPYPDFSLWLDSFVFINRTYAYSPPTIGVATFDGLNQKGYPYDFTASESSSKRADFLTSKPINLNYPAGDSIYFSFYYQQQGRGNSPALKDSLILEFKASGSSTWDRIWAKTGSSITFKDTLSWSIVMIPITKASYLKKGFQFRFKNYATVSGNLDHWHIDYVHLNRFRKFSNTIFQDVSFVYDHPSFLKTYQVMPWKQYTPAFSKSSLINLIRNNHSTAKTVSKIYTITDQTGAVFFHIPFNSKIGAPFSQVGYIIDSIKPIPAFPLLTDATTYFINESLTSLPDLKKDNDTLRYEQKFGNYFAYDDGSAESAFGLTKANAHLAVKFELNVADSLRYVDIYFNPILTNAADYTFNLKVWSDAGGVPGSEIITSRALHPRYSGSGQNNIIRYGLDAPLGLSAGIFYVGFMQNTNKPLNIGLDLNNNNQFNTFYNVGTGWSTSPYPGAAIFHPVFGKDSSVTAVSENKMQQNLVEVYPNPATTDLHIQATDFKSHKLIYSIIDVSGREVINNMLITPAVIDISNFSKGIYFIRVMENNNSSIHKFIKLE